MNQKEPMEINWHQRICSDKYHWYERSAFYRKSHTCEEGGAYLRVFFYHSLMNFEKPKKSDFWKYEKIAKNIIILHICTKKHTQSWGTVPEIQSETKIFVILGNFFPC